MDIHATFLGRRLCLGQYAIYIHADQLIIDGPDELACRESQTRLFQLLRTVEGCRTFGRALRSSSIASCRAAAAEIAKIIGLPVSDNTEISVDGPLPGGLEGKKLDYDEDQDAIRALNLPKIITRTITELEGICAAIVYDKTVSDEEVKMLQDWMKAKAEFLDAWPISELHQLLERILADGQITHTERSELMRFLDSIGASSEKCGQAADIIFADQPVVTFRSKTFLFTGKLLIAKRDDAKNAVLTRGGIIAGSPKFGLDYLVVGDLGTDAWQYSRYGRKIEAVMENRKDGARTLIIREDDFVQAINKNQSLQ
jgi:hypothetical protein